MINQKDIESSKLSAPREGDGTGQLSDYILQRLQRDERNSDSLVDSHILPSVELLEFKSPGPTATRAEIKNSDISVRHLPDGTTKIDYPDGITVESKTKTYTDSEGRKQEKHFNEVNASKPNTKKKNGDVVDPNGRIIAKVNDDGSVTVDSGKGFYTQDVDGTLHKETALRTRKGKDFEVLDTSTPLGNLRPGDMTKQK